jgi:O-antigen/teichoic acid export membrane protein
MRISLILRAVFTSWIAVVVNAAVGFLLTPYVLHHLGDEAYGLWVLTVNCVGYYGLLDLGVRSSILRYVSRHQALGNHESVNEVVATAFYYYLAACLVIVVATYSSVNWVSHFFPIHAQLLPAFKSLYLLAGVVQGLTLPLVVFAGSLEASGRYDQVYLTMVACLVLRVIAVLTVLHAGGGLFAVGAATILSQLLQYFIQVPLAIRANNGLSISPRWIRKSAFRDMFRYGSTTAAVGIGENLRGYIYPVLVAKFLSPVAVTLFSLPVKILAFPAQGIGTMTEIVNPLSSRLEAKNDFARLRELILNSSQAAFMVLVPMAAFLFVYGHELLTLWVGSRYTSAYTLLVLLTLGLGTAGTQCCIQSMLFGIDQHKALIWYRLGEGLSVAILGSAALRIWGLNGFAAVIAITLMLTSLVLVPRHLCRLLGLSLRRYILQGCLKPCLLAIPATATFIAMHHFLPVGSWADLFIAVVTGGLVYSLTLLLVMFSSSKVDWDWLQISVLQILDQKLFRARATGTNTATGILGSEEPPID